MKHAQHSFAWGEIDPLLYGRTDVEQYGMAAAKARNVWLLPQGGFRRRPGLEYIARIGTGMTPARMVPFEFNESTDYIVVICGDGNLRLYSTTGTLTATIAHPWADADIVEVNPAYTLGQIYFFHHEYQTRVLEYASGAWALNTVTFTNIPEYPFADSNSAVYPGVNHVEQVGLTNLDNNSTFTVVVNGHETAPVVFDAAVATTITNLVAAIEALPNVDANNVSGVDSGAGGGGDQAINVTMETNNGSRFWAFEPGKVIVMNSSVGGIVETSVVTKGEEVQEPVWGNGTAATGTLTLTANAGNNETVTINGKTYTFQAVLTNVDGNVLIGATASDSLDNLIAAINLGAGAGTLYATATTLHATVSAAAGAGDTMVVTAKTVGIAGNSYATTETMANGSWGAATMSGGTEKRGWPRCGAFFQGRLYVAGSKSLPNYLWFSRSGETTDFDTENDRDDMGAALQVDDAELSAIHKLVVNRHLQIFGSRAEYYIPKSDSEIITPSNASIRRTTQRGSQQGIPIIQVDGATYFVDRSRKQIRELLFSDAEQSYIATSLQRLAGHMLTHVEGIAFRRSQSTEEPDQVFIVDRDADGDAFGTLAVFATMRDENVAGWSLCTTFRGGNARYGAGASGFYDVCVLDDEVYCLVLRDITGGMTDNAMYIEKFNLDLELDCAKTGGAGATATGLSHLNSAIQLTHVVDNTVQGAITVAAGSATLGITATEKWQVGYDFPPLLDDDGDEAPQDARVWVQTLPVPSNLEDGTTINRKRRCSRAAVRIKDTSHIKVNGIEIVRRAAGASLDSPMPTVTGVEMVEGLKDTNYEGRLDITQDIPLPMKVLTVAQDVEFS